VLVAGQPGSWGGQCYDRHFGRLSPLFAKKSWRFSHVVTK
jgi:hypothetical protein